MPAERSDRELLLELHEQDRRAHLAGDADLLTAGMADFVWEASRGCLNRLSLAELNERFRSYFSSVRYSVWEDLQPPHVSVSADGRHAWMAVEIEARMTALTADGKEDQHAFESSWISVYEKSDDRWLMVGIASSVVDRT